MQSARAQQPAGSTSAAGGGDDVKPAVTQEEDPGERTLLSPAEIADVVFMPGGGGPDVTARTPEFTPSSVQAVFQVCPARVWISVVLCLRAVKVHIQRKCPQRCTGLEINTSISLCAMNKCFMCGNTSTKTWLLLF